MHVLLINPPARHLIRESLPAVVEDDTGVFPPLGLLYVAAAARAVPGCRVTVVDAQAEGLDQRGLARVVAADPPVVVGIQAMTFTLIDAIETARTVRRTVPGAVIVFGGPHPTLFPVETAALPQVDLVVRGEGEAPFARILEAVRGGRPAAGVDGVVTAGGPPAGGLPPLAYVADLDRLPPPARDLVDPGRYHSPLSGPGRVTTMMSSRGCPGRCVFCDRPQMGKRFRKRSAASVVAEMTDCVRRHGTREIKFYDDTFTIDRRRVLEICRRLAAARLDVAWEIRARVDTMTDETIAALARSGCFRIHYGVESGSPRIQRRIGKDLDLDRVRRVFAATRRAGIETLGYFMIGLPDETPRELAMTLRLLDELPMDYAHIAVFTPYPGTAIYRQALAEGVYETDYWRDFARRPRADFTPRYWNAHFSDAELLDVLHRAYARFYRRPRYIVERLRRIRSFEELWRKSLMGAKLLRTVTFGG